MQEQNFEKQVQQKMEELSFAPSTPVWQKVEKEIRKKRDRRRIIFWFLPLLLVSGIGIWWLNSRPLQQQITVNVPAVDKNIPATAPNSNKPSSDNTNGSAIVPTENHTKGFEKVNSTNQTVKANQLDIDNYHTRASKKEINVLAKSTSVYSKRVQNRGASISRTKGLEKVDPTTKENKKVPKHTTKPTGNEVPISEESAFSKNQPPITGEDTLVSTPVISEINNTQDTLVAATDTIKGNTITDSAVVTKDTIVSIVSAKSKKWYWSAGVNAGLSGVSTTAFRFSNPASSLYLYDAAPTQSLVSFAARPASKINNSFSIAAGASVYRRLNSKIYLTAGLQYHYYSTWNYVGVAVARDTNIIRNADFTAVSRYYRNSNSLTRYKNQYHFIEVPVGVQFSFLKGNRLQFTPGVSVGYLLATNAVYFNQQAGIYYRDESVFQKTFLSAVAQVTYKAFNLGKASVHIGPQAQLTATNLLNKNTSGRQHLYFAGVATKISFE